MKNSYVSYMKKGADVKVCCIVEYVDNAKDWDCICDGKAFTPWDCYKSRKFDDIGEAVEFYLVEFFKMIETGKNEGMPIENRVYDVKFWLDIMENDEAICGHYIELPYTVVCSLRQTFGVEQAREFYRLKEKAERQEKLLNAYSEFLEQHHIEKRFEEFLKQKEDCEYLPF